MTLENPWPRYPLPLPPAWAANPATAHLRGAEIRLAAIHCGLKVDDVVGPVTGLIVGEAPGPSGSIPLFPWPPQSAGARLRKMSGMPVGAYLGRVRRVNLSLNPHGWNATEATLEAFRIRELLAADLAWRRSSTSDAEPLRVLLLGERVSAAFRVREPFVQTEQADHTYVAIPHPSGRNRLYNDEKTRTAAGVAVRWCAGYLG